MRLSKYYSKIKVDTNQYAIFNTLLMEVLIVDEKELVTIESGDHSSVNLLKQHGIYATEKADLLAMKNVRDEYLHSCKDLEVLYIMLTDDCNYSCKYCYMCNMEANEYARENISRENAMKAVQLFGKYLLEKGHRGTVLFYGGEPLLRKALMKELILAGEKYNSIDFSVITNGSLIDHDIAHFLKKHDVEVGVSIDGYEDLNDYNRVYSDANGTYQDTLRGIETLESVECKHGLSITVSEETILNSNKIFDWIKRFKTNNIAFNFMQFANGDVDWKKYSDDFSTFLINAYKAFEERNIYENTIFRKINSFSKGEIKFANCAAVGLNQITVCSNGNIVICQGHSRGNDRHEINIKDISDFDGIFDMIDADMWMDKAPIMQDKCHTCEAFFVCGGGCALQSEAIWRDINHIDETFCIFTKNIFRWMLKNTYLNARGLNTE